MYIDIENKQKYKEKEKERERSHKRKTLLFSTTSCIFFDFSNNDVLMISTVVGVGRNNQK